MTRSGQMQLALVGLLALLCGAVIAISLRTSSSRPSLGRASESMALLVSRRRTARILLQPDESDPMPDLPVQQLDWLKEPAGGWPSWEPAADESSEDGVGMAAAAVSPGEPFSKSFEAFQLVVEQVLAHLRTSVALQEHLLGSYGLHATSLQLLMESNTSASPDASAVAVAAAAVAKGDNAVLTTASLVKQKPSSLPRPRPPSPQPPRPRLHSSPRPSPKPSVHPSARSPSPWPCPPPRPTLHPSPRTSREPARTAGASMLQPRPVPLASNTLPNAIEPAGWVPPPFHSGYSLPTGLSRPPAALPGGCLVSSSVMQFGAHGSGVVNDVVALRYANRSNVTVLYFPPGVYRIAENLQLTKPIVMGSRTKFQLDKGVVLTLSMPPRRAPIWYDPMFTGPGRVIMDGKVTEVYPAWWADSTLSDDQVLQAAVSSCLGPCTVLQTRTHFLKKAVTLTSNAGIFATANAGITTATPSTGEGLVVPAGDYVRQPLVLTSVRGFARFGIKVQGGVRSLNIQVGHIMDNNEGLVFESSSGKGIFNATLSHVSVMQSNQQAVVFSALAPGASFTAITVRMNFLLIGGFMAPAKPSSGVLFRGVVPELRHTQVIAQVIDPAQFLKITQFAAVATQTAAPVSNFVFRSDCWNGGYVRPGTQIAGAFRNSSFQIFFGDSVGGSVFDFQQGSSNNWLSEMELAAPGGFWSLVPAPGTLSQFVAANPTSPPQPWPLEFAGPTRHQGFWVVVMTTGPWNPGESRTYYLHSFFADQGVRGKMSCMPYVTSNMGLYCTSVTGAPGATAADRHRVAIKLMNLSRKVIPPQSAIKFAVQLGPD